MLNYQRATPGHGSKNVAAAVSRIRTRYGIYFANFDNHILQIGSHVPFICSILFNTHAQKNWLLDMYPKTQLSSKRRRKRGLLAPETSGGQAHQPNKAKGVAGGDLERAIFRVSPRNLHFQVKVKVGLIGIYTIRCIYNYIYVCVCACF